jgi:pectate lyase
MLCRLADNVTEVDGYGHVLRNNLSYKSRGLLVRFDATKCKAEGNSFTLDLKLTDRDFVSLDEAEFFQPRQPNGDLPKISALHPAAGSALIEAGVPIGAFGQ